jgi:hypothetical protein
MQRLVLEQEDENIHIESAQARILLLELIEMEQAWKTSLQA